MRGVRALHPAHFGNFRTSSPGLGTKKVRPGLLRQNRDTNVSVSFRQRTRVEANFHHLTLSTDLAQHSAPTLRCFWRLLIYSPFHNFSQLFTKSTLLFSVLYLCHFLVSYTLQHLNLLTLVNSSIRHTLRDSLLVLERPPTVWVTLL